MKIIYIFVIYVNNNNNKYVNIIFNLGVFKIGFQLIMIHIHYMKCIYDILRYRDK